MKRAVRKRENHLLSRSCNPPLVLAIFHHGLSVLMVLTDPSTLVWAEIYRKSTKISSSLTLLWFMVCKGQ